MPKTLLQPDEVGPVRIDNAASPSPFLILADHAGRAVPKALGDLGVPAAAMERHIAWDIGILAVSLRLAAALDAVLISQRYSRLVIDCNRAPGHPTSIPPASDGTPIRANQALGQTAIQQRVTEIFAPYHAAIAAEIDRRQRHAQPCIVIAMHSFTPVWAGVPRPWQAGILHDRNPRFGLAVGDLLRRQAISVGDNQPYQLTDESDYTVPVHAEARGLDYVELEIRQDLIATEPGQQQWAERLTPILPAALAQIAPASS